MGVLVRMNNFVTAWLLLFRFFFILQGVMALPSVGILIDIYDTAYCKFGDKLLFSECILRIFVIGLIFANDAGRIFK